MSKFPIWYFHKDFPEGKIIQDEKQFKTVGEGWVTSPTLFETEPEVIEVEETEVAPKKKKSVAK